jgi:hypothetical protein
MERIKWNFESEPCVRVRVCACVCVCVSGILTLRADLDVHIRARSLSFCLSRTRRVSRGQDGHGGRSLQLSDHARIARRHHRQAAGIGRKRLGVRSCAPVSAPRLCVCVCVCVDVCGCVCTPLEPVPSGKACLESIFSNDFRSLSGNALRKNLGLFPSIAGDRGRLRRAAWECVPVATARSGV